MSTKGIFLIINPGFIKNPSRLTLSSVSTLDFEKEIRNSVEKFSNDIESLQDDKIRKTDFTEFIDNLNEYEKQLQESTKQFNKNKKDFTVFLNENYVKKTNVLSEAISNFIDSINEHSVDIDNKRKELNSNANTKHLLDLLYSDYYNYVILLNKQFSKYKNSLNNIQDIQEYADISFTVDSVKKDVSNIDSDIHDKIINSIQTAILNCQQGISQFNIFLKNLQNEWFPNHIIEAKNEYLIDQLNTLNEIVTVEVEKLKNSVNIPYKDYSDEYNTKIKKSIDSFEKIVANTFSNDTANVDIVLKLIGIFAKLSIDSFNSKLMMTYYSLLYIENYVEIIHAALIKNKSSFRKSIGNLFTTITSILDFLDSLKFKENAKLAIDSNEFFSRNITIDTITLDDYFTAKIKLLDTYLLNELGNLNNVSSDVVSKNTLIMNSFYSDIASYCNLLSENKFLDSLYSERATYSEDSILFKYISSVIEIYIKLSSYFSTTNLLFTNLRNAAKNRLQYSTSVTSSLYTNYVNVENEMILTAFSQTKDLYNSFVTAQKQHLSIFNALDTENKNEISKLYRIKYSYRNYIKSVVKAISYMLKIFDGYLFTSKNVRIYDLPCLSNPIIKNSILMRLDELDSNNRIIFNDGYSFISGLYSKNPDKMFESKFGITNFNGSLCALNTIFEINEIAILLYIEAIKSKVFKNDASKYTEMVTLNGYSNILSILSAFHINIDGADLFDIFEKFIEMSEIQ